MTARIRRRRHRFQLPAAWRLGSVECALFALIVLGVAITAAMAILDP